MSVVFKCMLALFAVLCFVQLVEMTRVRRDDAPKEGATGGLDLNEALNSLVTKLKSSLDEDTLKKILAAGQNAINEGSEALKKGLNTLSGAAQNLANNGNGGAAAGAGH